MSLAGIKTSILVIIKLEGRREEMLKQRGFLILIIAFLLFNLITLSAKDKNNLDTQAAIDIVLKLPSGTIFVVPEEEAFIDIKITEEDLEPIVEDEAADGVINGEYVKEINYTLHYAYMKLTSVPENIKLQAKASEFNSPGCFSLPSNILEIRHKGDNNYIPLKVSFTEIKDIGFRAYSGILYTRINLKTLYLSFKDSSTENSIVGNTYTSCVSLAIEP